MDTDQPQGSIFIKIIKSENMRLKEAGTAPSAAVLLRIREATQSDTTWKSSAAASGTTAEWNEEFRLPVKDPNGNVQLECTLWDESKSQARTPEDFLGEVILNLSKLVPYKGKYIEQVFEIKSSKTIKTTPAATGKLKLGLRLDIPAQTDFTKPMQSEASQPKSLQPDKAQPTKAPQRERAAPPSPPAQSAHPTPLPEDREKMNVKKDAAPAARPSPRNPESPQPVSNTSPRTPPKPPSPRLLQTQPVQPASQQSQSGPSLPPPAPAPIHHAPASQPSAPPSQPVPSHNAPNQPSAFTSPQNQQKAQAQPRPALPSKGGPANVGIDIRLGAKDSNGVCPLVVHELLPGGPAAKSQQIQTGDVLIDIDGNDVVGRGVEEVQKALHGAKGAPVTLILRRGGSSGPQIVATVLRAIPPFTPQPAVPTAGQPPPVQQAKVHAPPQQAEIRKAPPSGAVRERAQVPQDANREAKVPFRVSQARTDYAAGPLGSFEAVKREYNSLSFLWGNAVSDPALEDIGSWKEDVLFGPKRAGHVSQRASLSASSSSAYTSIPPAYATVRAVANPGYRQVSAGSLSPRATYQYPVVQANEARYAPVASIDASRASYGGATERSMYVSSHRLDGPERGMYVSSPRASVPERSSAYVTSTRASVPDRGSMYVPDRGGMYVSSSRASVPDRGSMYMSSPRGDVTERSSMYVSSPRSYAPVASMPHTLYGGDSARARQGNVQPHRAAATHI